VFEAVLNGDVCVGARQWDTSNCGGGFCDLPVMGYDGSEWTEGYMNTGETPTIKIYDCSLGIMYETCSDPAIDPWTNNIIPKEQSYILMVGVSPVFI
jgi:hypothetical protein